MDRCSRANAEHGALLDLALAPQNPIGLALSRNGDGLFVLSSRAPAITVPDAASLALLETNPLQGVPARMTISSKGDG